MHYLVVVLNVQKDSMFTSIENSESLSFLNRAGQFRLDEVHKPSSLRRYVDLHQLVFSGFRNIHVPVCLYYTISISQSNLFGFEEIIGHIQVDTCAPLLHGLVLVPRRSGIMSDKDPVFRDRLRGVLIVRIILAIAPCEIVDVVLHEIPIGSEVLCDVELFVDLARLI